MNHTSDELKPAEEELSAAHTEKGDDRWLVVAACSGDIFLPEREMEGYYSGYRTAILWLWIPTLAAALAIAYFGS